MNISIAPPDRPGVPPLRRLLAATAMLVVLTGYLTWPQALHMNSQVARHDDAFFSMWRLGWIAHQLKADPAHLYDANIFYPEQRTLAYSDAIIFEGAVAAPLLWAGMTPAGVYNLMLLSGIVLSGVGMFVLAWYLTRNEDAALIAAVIFLMVPYRVDHFMHLELQWTAWIPLTFWAFHRAFDARSIRHGILAGVLIWFQLLSSIYYGVILGLASAVFVVLLWLIVERLAIGWKTAAGFLAGGVLALLLTAVATRPYVANTATVGTRSIDQVAQFSASPADYFASPEENWWWGQTENWSPGDERHLFLGVIAIGLVLLGLALRPPRVVWVYAVLAALFVELSFGTSSPPYVWLHDHVFVLQGLRSVARFAIIVISGLSVIAGFGFAALQARWPVRLNRLSPLVVCLVLLATEYGSAPMKLEPVPSDVPEVYRLLRQLPRGVVAELPVPNPESIPAYDSLNMFSSLWHFYPLMNGYSGFFSPRYRTMIGQLQGFPDDDARAALCQLPVRYVVVHESRYEPPDYAALLERMVAMPDFQFMGQYKDIYYARAAIFELRCP